MHVDKVVDVHVVRVVQVSEVQVVEEIFEIPQLLFVEKIVVILEVPSVQFSQTTGSLGIACAVQLLDQVVDMPVGVPTSAGGTVVAPQLQFIVEVMS